MSGYKPVLFVFLFIFIVAFILNIFVAPYSAYVEPVNDSIMNYFIDFVNIGINLSVGSTSFIGLLIPSLADITLTPVTWLWFGIDPITEFFIQQLTLMSYIPNSILIPLLIILLGSFAYAIISIIRGIS